MENFQKPPEQKRLDVLDQRKSDLFGKQYGTKMKRHALLPPLDKRYLRSDVLDCIWRCCGIQTQICIALDCTPRQLNTWLNRHPEAQAEMAKAREGILARAQEVILGALGSEDERIKLEAAKAVLKQSSAQPTVQVNVGMGTQAQKIKAVFGLADDTAVVDVDADEDA